MTDNKDLNFYYSAIKSIDSGANNLRQPEIGGRNATVFFADVDQETYVYRFTDKPFIQRNQQIGSLLAQNNICAPRPVLCEYNNTYFEKYLYNAGKTMYEHNASAPLSEQESFNIYKELMQTEYNISAIPVSSLGNIKYKFYSEIYSAKHSAKHAYPIAQVMDIVMHMLSRAGEMRLFHNDPTPTNILLTHDKHISCMLDLDSICISNTYFALIKMLQYCPEYMWSDLLRYYADISHQPHPNNWVALTIKLLRQFNPKWTQFSAVNNISR